MPHRDGWGKTAKCVANYLFQKYQPFDTFEFPSDQFANILTTGHARRIPDNAMHAGLLLPIGERGHLPPHKIIDCQPHQ